MMTLSDRQSILLNARRWHNDVSLGACDWIACMWFTSRRHVFFLGPVTRSSSIMSARSPLMIVCCFLLIGLSSSQGKNRLTVPGLHCEADNHQGVTLMCSRLTECAMIVHCVLRNHSPINPRPLGLRQLTVIHRPCFIWFALPESCIINISIVELIIKLCGNSHGDHQTLWHCCDLNYLTVNTNSISGFIDGNLVHQWGHGT